MSEKYSLKDELFNAQKVAYLGDLFANAHEWFDADAFGQEVMSQMLDLELKDRIFWIAEVLGRHLPDDFGEACDAILAALPAPLDPSKTDNDFGDFIFCPLGEYVALRAVSEDFERGLDMLEVLTQRFSMEWPIRPFLIADADRVLACMEDWALSGNYHVRRLVSEGTRPKLPWGAGIGLDVARPLSLLDVLHRDPTRYVTRSVANHLNDISKTNPDLVLDTLERWQSINAQAPKELKWMASHALRGLIKAGHPRALSHLGYAADVDVKVVDFKIDRDTLKMGETLAISFALSAPKDTPVLVDYSVDFVKANGDQRPKVFKLKQGVVKAGAPLVFSKKHTFKHGATTFALYDGRHRINVQVNGRVLAGLDFDLTSP